MALPMASHLRTQDSPRQLAEQEIFTANLLEIQSQQKIGDRRVNVTSPAALEVILKKKLEISSLGRNKNSDQSYFDEHRKVPQD